ncbi:MULTISPECIES: 2-oxo-4-hydroxy-4-carboxy-5-ureidoimidazoline decarboxylase [Rhodococcus]|uniref:2-oxo-4-hydroxy-4-carboxy-5-ureidoimidazoline decarboxylase n=1 Tax=Rhodococcus globerulus TaxID=33008 RepID=UPI001C59CE94|nr:2-oxo-4-hydroxy-4-carboxy-5-ureidoimidazoline decarboxylase [Rhodococcus globerulus]QXW04965.1 OHCU decarboxylase [Rhodococcus globerulus]
MRRGLYACTPSHVWVERVVAAGSFADSSALLDVAEREWSALSALEIEEILPLYLPLSATPDSESTAAEHAAMIGSAATGMERLRLLEAAYRERFGFGVVIAAEGLTLDTIESLVADRLLNERAHEIEVAKENIINVGRRRLVKLFGEGYLCEL